VEHGTNGHLHIHIFFFFFLSFFLKNYNKQLLTLPPLPPDPSRYVHHFVAYVKLNFGTIGTTGTNTPCQTEPKISPRTQRVKIFPSWGKIKCKFQQKRLDIASGMLDNVKHGRSEPHRPKRDKIFPTSVVSEDFPQLGKLTG
jgi:hypothetical protein